MVAQSIGGAALIDGHRQFMDYTKSRECGKISAFYCRDMFVSFDTALET